MPGAILTVAELAAEIGRSETWIYDHWEVEARCRRLPRPLHGGARPLVWSRAHVYAALDASLTPLQRLAAQAYRAAAAAAAEQPHVSPHDLAEVDARARLDEIYGGLKA